MYLAHAYVLSVRDGEAMHIYRDNRDMGIMQFPWNREKNKEEERRTKDGKE